MFRNDNLDHNLQRTYKPKEKHPIRHQDLINRIEGFIGYLKISLKNNIIYMRIKNFGIYFFVILFPSLTFSQPPKKEIKFLPGEKLSFELKYGWFTMGKAQITLDNTIHTIRNEDYYQTDIYASTAGLMRLFDGIDDHFSGLINVEDYKPITSEKHIKHKRGEWEQWNKFDYDRMKVDAKGKKWGNDYMEYWSVDLTQDTYDILGTYLYLRGIDWSKYEKGDSVMFKTFFEEKLYDFGVEHGGTEEVKFNDIKYTAQKLYGLFPLSRTFPKERAVTVWVINYDGVNLPVRMEAQIKFGKVKIDLVGFSVGDLVLYEY